MTYRPATRADLVPGAVFVVRKTSGPLARDVGAWVVLHHDDNSNCPYFRREDGRPFSNGSMNPWLYLHDLERIHPPATDTVAIPRDVAREFVRTHLESGWAEIRGSTHACAVLRAALLSADPTLLAPPPPMPDEVAAARLVIERAGMRVVS